MRTVKNFEEYIDDGIVKKQTPDHARARYLKQEATNAIDARNEVLQEIGLSDKNANLIIKESYDAIMALIRAHMLEEGLNATGQGAHEAEVAYLRKLGIKETEIEFADTLRYRRNGILYYGKRVDKEYAEKVLSFTEKTIKKLSEKK